MWIGLLNNMKKIFIIILCIIPVMLSACWDKVEIDKRVFISTIGIDAGEDISKTNTLKKFEKGDPFQEIEFKKLKVTYAYPNISALTPQMGGTAETKYINVEAYSLQDAVSKATNKSSRSISFGHLQLLAINKNVLQQPDTVKEIVDYLQRQPAINRTMLVAVVEGDIEGFLKYKPEMEKNIESYLSGLMENNAKFGSIRKLTLDDLLKSLSANGNTIIPYITYDRDKNEMNLQGVATIKDYALKGFLTAREYSDIEFLRGGVSGGKKVVFVEGHPVDFSISNIKRKIKTTRQGDKLIFNIYLTIEGEIKEYYAGKEVFNNSFIKDIEENFDESLSKEFQDIIKITQRENGIDVIGLRENVEKYHPFIWKELGSKWDTVYKNSEVNVFVTTKIRRVGVVK